MSIFASIDRPGARFHAAAGRPGWLPVADALGCLERRSLRDALSRQGKGISAAKWRTTNYQDHICMDYKL